MYNSAKPYGTATSASAGNPSTTSIASNGAIGGNIGIGTTGASRDMTSTLEISDNQTFNIGPDFTITGRTLKACLKAMLPIAMVEYPEDFV
jgi:hypothetical protein